ncbi:MAG: L-2-amino-thiazoline-4-carboxylic acid hydrolase [Candidatus Hermodarchaeota archaeon]
MKVQKYGEYNPELKETFNPVEFTERAVLFPLDHLLGMLLQHNPEIHQQFITELISKIQPMIETNYVKIKSIDIQKTLRKLENLKNYPELAEVMVNLSLKLYNLPENIAWENAEIDILERNISRGSYFPNYYQVLVLSKITEKKEAFDLYKNHYKLYREKRHRIQKYEDLEAVREFFIAGAEEWGTVHIISEVTAGKLIVRRDYCTISEVLKELDDPELAHLIACSGDFGYWKASNPNFVLTRKYTLMEGHPYCDFVFHDTRINEDLNHPSKEFFDKLWPKDQ